MSILSRVGRLYSHLLVLGKTRLLEGEAPCNPDAPSVKGRS